MLVYAYVGVGLKINRCKNQFMKNMVVGGVCTLGERLFFIILNKCTLRMRIYMYCYMALSDLRAIFEDASGQE